MRSLPLILVTVLAGCPLEQEPATTGDPCDRARTPCRPGEVACAGDGYIQVCDDDGCLGEREPFVCAVGECMIYDNEPVCL